MLLIRNFICKSPDYFTIWFSAGQWVRGAEKMNGRVKLAADKGIKKLRILQGNVKDRERKN